MCCRRFFFPSDEERTDLSEAAGRTVRRSEGLAAVKVGEGQREWGVGGRDERPPRFHLMCFPWTMRFARATSPLFSRSHAFHERGLHVVGGILQWRFGSFFVIWASAKQVRGRGGTGGIVILAYGIEEEPTRLSHHAHLALFPATAGCAEAVSMLFWSMVYLITLDLLRSSLRCCGGSITTH